MISAQKLSIRLLYALVGVVSLAGCPSEPNSLEGSIDETMSLEFDRTEMRRFDGITIQLDYLKDLEGGDIDIVAKVVFDTPADGIVADEEIDILANNGIIERRASDNLDFPPLEQGAITFSSGGNEPGAAVGRFTATFDNGKTLGGNFDTELTDVEF
jgi:hypothetical protein